MTNANKNLGIKKNTNNFICHTDIEEEEALIDIVDMVGEDHIMDMVGDASVASLSSSLS